MTLKHSELSISKSNKIKNFTIILISIFAFITLIGTLNHVMWRDELNGWLIARDSHSFIDFFENIKYEGHPLLWYVFLWILNQITDNPLLMQIFHWLISLVTVALFVLFSPFTKSQKILFVFGYLPIYEYSLISRNYSIGILSIFLFCTYFQTRYKSYIPLAFILAIMANTNAYCLLISFALGVSLAIEYVFKDYFQYQTTAKLNNIVIGLIIFFLGISLSVFMLFPPLDSTLQGGADQWFFEFDFNRLTQAMTRIWRSYILVIIPSDSKSIDLLIFSSLSLGLFCFAVLMLLKKPIALVFYLMGTLEILSFTYAKFLGSQRHYGHLYIILIAALWIASYYKSSRLVIQILEDMFDEFFKTIISYHKWVLYHKKSFIIIILWLQVIAGIVAFSRDLITPYSSSKVTANYIKNNNLSNYFIMGSEDFTIAPISGYLNKKIYYPESKQLGSYVLFNNTRKVIDDDDIIEQLIEIINSKIKNILLIRNQKFLGESSQLDIQFLEKFTNSFIYNEKYYLYLIKSNSDLNKNDKN